MTVHVDTASPSTTLAGQPAAETAPELPADLSRREYEQALIGLSQASVDRHFDAFIDIPWDHPDFAVDPTDPRWALPENDPLGAHPWYKAQSLERRIEIGMWRQANIMKVGLQFENILIRGIMQYVFARPNGSAEFRYLTHEATEECHHTQMFQQGVNRIGVDVPGMPRWLRTVAPILPLVASRWSVGFFIGVLAGEEPIDHTQKRILRDAADMPPVLRRIMEIHVAEEARHISFAHQYIQRQGPRLKRGERFVTSLLYPVIMRALGDAILVPPKEMSEKLGIPREVIKELYWDAPESKAFLSELFADVRMLAEESGLMTRTSRRVWRALGIDGRASRYRSEPAPTFVDPQSRAA